MPSKSSRLSSLNLQDSPRTRYFGGSLEFVSLDGWGEISNCVDLMHRLIDLVTFAGSDVFVKLRCLDDAGDAEI